MQQDIKTIAYSLLALFCERLPERDVKSIQELIKAGEELIAIENLCTQLYEWDCRCSLEEIRQVEAVAERLRLHETYIGLLYQLVDAIE